jgi:hypothetical protein
MASLNNFDNTSLIIIPELLEYIENNERNLTCNNKPPNNNSHILISRYENVNDTDSN